MSTESLAAVQNQSLAYTQSLNAIDPADDSSFAALWFTTLKLGLNTAQGTLEELRDKVERTNSQLAGVQHAQSELQLQLNSGAISNTATLASILAPGRTRDDAYWSGTAGLSHLQAALVGLNDSALVADETASLEDLVAGALATQQGGGASFDSALGATLNEVYLFAGGSMGAFTGLGAGDDTAEAVKGVPAFQTQIADLAADLAAILGDPTITKNSTAAELRQAMVGAFNAVMRAETAAGSELGRTILQYVGEEPSGGATEQQIVQSAGGSLSDLFATAFGGSAYSIETLFAKIDVDVDDATTIDKVLARLESGHQAKSSLSTLETLDLKIASQTYSNHLSLLTKMVTDRLNDVQSMLRDW